MYHEIATPSQFKTPISKLLAKKEDFGTFEYQLVAVKRRFLEYVSELQRPPDPKRQLHIFDLLVSSVTEPEGHRKLAQISKSSQSVETVGSDAWQALRTFYLKNTNARQADLHDMLQTPQSPSENAESFIDRIMLATTELAELGDIVSDSTNKSALARGLDPAYGPYIAHPEHHRYYITLDDYSEAMINSTTVYEERQRKALIQDGASTHLNGAPHPFG